MRKILVLTGASLLVILIAIMAISLFLSHSKTAGARKVSDTFIGYVSAGDGDKSFAMLSGSTRSSLTTSGWGLQTAKLSLFFAGNHPHLTTSSIKGTQYTYTYSISAADGTYTWQTTLVPAGKTWQVLTFTSTLNNKG